MKINRFLLLAGCVLLTGCGSKPKYTYTNYVTPTDSAIESNSVTPGTSTPVPENNNSESSVIPTQTPSDAQTINPGSSETYYINSGWEFAEFSKINSGAAVLYQTSSSNPKNKTVCINAGHGTSGGTDYSVQCHPDGSPKIVSGSTSAGKTTATAIAYGTTMLDGNSEAYATKQAALVVKEVLLDNGYNVLMIRESDDVALDNIARTVMANNLADCHIAIHYDSTDYDKGAFYMSVPDVDDYKNMYPVSNIWWENNRLGESIMSGFRANDIKIFSSGSMEMDLVQMSYSTIPNIDLEVGDTASDYGNDTLNQLAKGILDGLNTYYGF